MLLAKYLKAINMSYNLKVKKDLTKMNPRRQPFVQAVGITDLLGNATYYLIISSMYMSFRLESF
jgi:hypothetical protein